jgi:hypothetical protein
VEGFFIYLVSYHPLGDDLNYGFAAKFQGSISAFEIFLAQATRALYDVQTNIGMIQTSASARRLIFRTPSKGQDNLPHIIIIYSKVTIIPLL